MGHCLPPRIRVLLFDAGGTLVFPNFRRIAAELEAEGLVVDPERLRRAELAARFRLDREDFVQAPDADRWGTFLEAIATEAGVPGFPAAALARLAAYHGEHNLWEDVPDDVPRVLEQLGRHFRLGLVSNANGTVGSKLERLGLARHFETVVDSGIEGIEKPDPRLFRIALERMRAAPEETAYIGDVYHIDVVGAEAAGLHPVLIDPASNHAERNCARIQSLADLLAAR